MLDEKQVCEALEFAAAAPPRSGLFDVIKRARAAGVKVLDIVAAFIANRGDVAKIVEAIEALIPKPPATA